MNFISRLREPFPDRATHNKNLLSLVGVGAFVALFLYTLKPFGLESVEQGLWWICGGFGLVTILFGWMYDVLMRYVLKIRTDLPSWTLGKWILQSCGLLVWVATGNCLYMIFVLGYEDASAFFLINMVFNTALVGFFPIVFSGLSTQLKAAEKNRLEAETIHPKASIDQPTTPSLVTLSGDGEWKMEAKNIRFVESMQNYVCIHCYTDGTYQKEVIRDTIANTESKLAQTSIVRCHRSYLVNIDHIQQVGGNAQGLKLQLSQVEGFEVPVSRSYVAELRTRIGTS